MRQQELLNEARDLLAQFVTRVKGATAMGHTDINVISEAFLTELLREVFGLSALRNLNQDKKNFPGIDLADDVAGIEIKFLTQKRTGDVIVCVLPATLYSKVAVADDERS